MKQKYSKILLLGSAALKIGEAGEFDYSGSQAIKSLREEGIKTILINPNIATIQTSENLADKVYFLPVTPDFVEKVIEKEKPDGILLGVGGQTALNCGIELDEKGVLKKHSVQVVGTPVKAILETEDRAFFIGKLNEIDVNVPRAKVAGSLKDAVTIAEEIGFPVMMRIGFALGGLGSGRCDTKEELEKRVEKALAYTDQVL
ncbi:MAG: carbamoyl phosphate synthase large subunit, partial [Nitrospinota bacterium]